MPIQKTIMLYQYDELPTDKAKERARDWYREASAGDNYFAEPVIEDATTIARILGFEIDKDEIAWSGFSSQGDGASFTGTYVGKPSTVEAEIRAYAPQDADLHRIAGDLADLGHVTFSIVRVSGSGSYCHPYTVQVDGFDPRDEEDPEDAYDEANEAIRAFMAWIYQQLKTEYEYRQTDETIEEDIRANEYTFRENGRRADD